MSGLSARLLARGSPQTLHSARFLEPITRRGVPTIGAIQSQPSLQLLDPLQQPIAQGVFLGASELADIKRLRHAPLQSYPPLFASPSASEGPGELQS